MWGWDWTAIGAGVAFVGVIVAIFVAVRAKNEAREANWIAESATRIAREALDLQTTIDERAREFRDVHWDAGTPWAGDGTHHVFTLRNDGLTPARAVNLIIEYDGWPREHHKLGDIGPFESKSVDSPSLETWRLANEHRLPSYPAFTVHWTSDKGKVGRKTHGEKCFFPATDS